MRPEEVRYQVEFDEVEEAIRELTAWRRDVARLPVHLRDRIEGLDTSRQADLFMIVRDGPVVRAELTPKLRALIGTLRAYRG